MTDRNDIKTPRMTFGEFSSMSDEAGFASTPEQKETDYWLGTTLADVVDAVQDLVETSPPPTQLAELAQIVGDLSALTLKAIEEGHVEQARNNAIALAASTVRALAYVCRDDGTD